MARSGSRRDEQASTAGAATLLESSVRRRIVDTVASLPTTPDPEGRLPGLTAAELAEGLDLHVTTVRFHLDQLVAGQLLTTEFRAGQVGRPRKLYRFKPGSLTTASPDDAYRALAELLAESWSATEDGLPLTPEQAGRRWAEIHTDPGPDHDQPARTPGAWLGKVGRSVDLLAKWGYSPELTTTNGGRTAELTLHDCPFLALAQTQPEVVCGVHQGLLRGAMEAVGEPDTEVTLRPFVGPGRCQATLSAKSEFMTPATQAPPDRQEDR